jgi:uncharacterized membrane protein YsdA (DUF1294 family)
MTLLLIFTLGFAKVAARAFQQKNVMHDQFRSVVPTSYVMAFLEVAFVGMSAIEITENGYYSAIPLALAYGTGGWTGCWFAMWLHKRINK